jgi:hypothetical protein
MVINLKTAARGIAASRTAPLKSTLVSDALFDLLSNMI